VRLHALILLVAGCGFAPTTEHIERIATRDGVTLPVLVVEPPHPQGVVVLFPGAGGQLGLSTGGIDRLADNLLVRTRGRFADEGFVAIVIDAPSDQLGDLDEYRVSIDEAVDTNRVVMWARQEWSLPVWLVGTSRGTISAANAAAHGAAIDGLVLASTVTAGDSHKATLRDVGLDEIKVPTLFVHHTHDRCFASPISGAREIAKQLKGEVAWTEISGGAKPSGAACSADSFHGFAGRDGQVVHAISQFIFHGAAPRLTL